MNRRQFLSTGLATIAGACITTEQQAKAPVVAREARPVDPYLDSSRRPDGWVGWDPDLSTPSAVHWTSVLSPEEFARLSLLVDVVLPATTSQPSASEVGVHTFIAEWISAPYPTQRADYIDIRKSLSEAVDSAEVLRHFTTTPASHWRRLKELVVIGYYTTALGMAELGYREQVQMTQPDIPIDVLRHFGLV